MFETLVALASRRCGLQVFWFVGARSCTPAAGSLPNQPLVTHQAAGGRFSSTLNGTEMGCLLALPE